MTMQPHTDEANFTHKNYREISSWLMGMRERGEKKDWVETTQQLILVVDNKPMRQFYTSLFLQRLEYHVITTKTAEDALTFLTISIPWAIIADVQIPKMGGLGLLKKVKLDRRTRDIPFIIYASNNDPKVKQHCDEAGCAAYLTQAPSLDELYVTIQKATEKKPRSFVRLTTHLDVVIGESLPGENTGAHDYITAVSEKGMFVSTNRHLAPGSVHTFTFFLPTSPGWLFMIEGEIIYDHMRNDCNKQPGVGVKFLKIETSARELIRNFIKETLMDGVAKNYYPR